MPVRVSRYLMGAAALAALSGMATDADCQTSSTAPRMTLQGPAEDSGVPVIRDVLNRPCLDVEAAARSHVVNPTMIDHIVSIKNNCPKVIKVKVCYFNSDTCNEFDVSGYSRVDTVLGTMAGVREFKYQIFQKLANSSAAW